MYLPVQLNNTLPNCDNSPTFENDPVPFTCVLQPTVYNHGVVDADGDSLWFSLVECLDGAASPVTYISPLSAEQPLSTTEGVVIDPVTGTIFFTPDMEQIGVLCVRVEEFRNGVKIGEVTRDIQFSVVDQCLNDFPVASGMNGSSDYDTAVCPGNQVQFDIYTIDSNPFNSITMSWNQGIPGGTFTVTPGQHPYASFSWLPAATDLGIHFFTVTVKDDACPVIGTNVFAFVVEVRNPNINAGPDTAICIGDSLTLDVMTSVDFTSFNWWPNMGISSDTAMSPTFYPETTTTYYLHAANSFCEAFDTVTITVGHPPTLTMSDDVAICADENTVISASGGDTYSWEPAGTLSDATTDAPTASPVMTTMYTVTSWSVEGCESTDSVLVTVNELPEITAEDATICEGEQTELTASGGESYEWEPAEYIAGANSGTTITAEPPSTMTYIVTGTDQNGCKNTGAVEVAVLSTPWCDAGEDIEIYKGWSTRLTGEPSTSADYWQWSPEATIVEGSKNDLSIVVSPPETTTYYFTVWNQLGCDAVDSVTVIVDPEGVFFMPNAFSPNGDQINDKFYVVNLGPVNLDFFRVYNRWGQVVFESNVAGEPGGWDGTFKSREQPAGVYTYVVRAISIEDGSETVLSGNITLMR